LPWSVLILLTLAGATTQSQARGGLGPVLQSPTGAASAPAPSVSAVSSGAAQAAVLQRAAGLVGIVDGPALLYRGSTRYGLLEGVRLQPDDIVEAPKGSVVQIEFGDGSRLALADNARAMVQPHWLARRGQPGLPRAYLLQGWFKLHQPAASSSEFVTPGVRFSHEAGDGKLSGTTATAVFQVGDAGQDGPSTLDLFVEAGVLKVTERSEPLRHWSLKGDDFFSRQGGDRPVLTSRPSSDFLGRLPVAFRDALPSRVARYAERGMPPSPQGDLNYADVASWLRGEPLLRAAMVEQLRSRLGDANFRTSVQNNLARHPEWERPLAGERQPPVRGGAASH
jgi:hypothetical protein